MANGQQITTQGQGAEEPKTLKDALAVLKEVTQELDEIERIYQEKSRLSGLKGLGDLTKLRKQKNAKRKKQISASNEVLKLLISPQEAANEEALDELKKVASPDPDWFKVICVVVAIVMIAGVVIAVSAMTNNWDVLAIGGMVVAAVGKISESVGKAEDVQANPRFMDGIALLGESLKILGVLAVLASGVIAI